MVWFDLTRLDAYDRSGRLTAGSLHFKVESGAPPLMGRCWFYIDRKLTPANLWSQIVRRHLKARLVRWVVRDAR